MDLLGWIRTRPEPIQSGLRPETPQDAPGAGSLLRVARLAVNPLVAVADLLRAVTEELAHALGGPVDLYAWTPDREGLALRASCGWNSAGLAMARLEARGSLVASLAEGPSRPFTLPASAPPPVRAIDQGILAGVSAPITAHELDWGVLIAWSAEPLNVEEARLVRDVAELVGDTVAARLGGALPAATRGDGVLVVDGAHRLRMVCPTAELMLGVSAQAIQGRTIDEIPALAPLLPALYSQQSEGAVQVGGRALELSFRRVLGPRGGAAVQVLLRDVTRRQRAEQEVAQLQEALAQARRLEAVGTVAAGLAHDFNNLLTVILNTGSMLLRDEPLTPSGRADLEQVVEAAERSSALVRQLLTFTPEEPAKWSAMRPAAVLSRVRPMLSLLLHEEVRLAVEIDSDAAVRADLGQLEQVVMNLVLNARDALPRGGTIRLALQEAQREGRGWVCLFVEDDGLGMSAPILDRIFEPFFTTRSSTGGTGLGLPTVQRIVRACGGRVEVESAPARGSRFTVWLPIHDEVGELAPLQVQRAPGVGVLWVEVDEEARAHVARMLGAMGFGVIEARSAEEAARAWGHEVSPVDLLLIGSVGPHPGDGIALLQELRALRPGAPAVLLTPAGSGAAALPGDVGILRRPFGMEELVDVLERALDADGTLDPDSLRPSPRGGPVQEG